LYLLERVRLLVTPNHREERWLEPAPSNGYEIVSREPAVFVVDPDVATRNAVRELVGMMGMRCETYASGQELMDACSRSAAGCVVLELKIPGIGGIQIQRLLKVQGNEIPVIFLTAHPELSIAVEAMRAGAVHFLQKPLRSNELWNAIQEAVETDEKRRRERNRRECLKKRLASLTSKELEVLSLIGQGKSNRQIASHMKVCVRTVEAHRARLAKKINVSSLRELLDIAIALATAELSENPPRSPLGPTEPGFRAR
jgi:FixJ family two-component response regulator